MAGYSIAPPIILVLIARTVLAKLLFGAEPSFLDSILTGAWQGILVYHIHAQYPFEAAALVGAAVMGKLAFDLLVLGEDSTRVVAAVLGMVLGVLGLDVSARVLELSELPPPVRGGSSSRPAARPRKDRTVQFRRSGSLERRRGDEREHTSRRRLRHADSLENSIITAPSMDMSLPSISEVTDSTRPSMSTLQREVQELRTRASLADTERRRFREEKKWAESQGNVARAEQMKWNIKRYTALMESFNKEADRKVVEDARQRAKDLNDLDEHSAAESSPGPIYILPPR